MNRLSQLLATFFVISLLTVGCTSLSDEGMIDRRDESQSNDPTPIALEEGAVQERTTNGNSAGYSGKFTYYVIMHGVSYDELIYREPNRLGEGVRLVMGPRGTSTYRLGITDPLDGVRNEVVHTGTVSL